MFIVVLVYLVLIIVWLNFERRSIKDELREEVKMGIISPEEYAILPTVFRRRSYYLQLVLKGQLRGRPRAGYTRRPWTSLSPKASPAARRRLRA